MRRVCLLASFFFFLILPADLLKPQSGGCSRECLRGLLDSYLSAMGRHDAAKLPAVPGAKFTENGKALQLGDGLWKTAGSVPYRAYAFDTQNGTAAAQAVVRENGALASFLLRIKVAEGKITEAETIVCRKGEAPSFAPEKLTGANALYTQMVSSADRTARKDLQAAAEAYFTAVQSEGTANYKPAPLADDAERFENGLQTTNVPLLDMPAATASEQLEKGYFKGVTITRRRYPVVDVDHGLVLGIATMRIPGETAKQNQNLLLAELFKVTGGKIKQVQAVMVNQPSDGSSGWN